MQNSHSSDPTHPVTNTNNAADLDLVGTSCPMAFVKTRIFLDSKIPGDCVNILFEATAANEPLIRSIKALGHTVTTNHKPHGTHENLKEITVKIQV